MSTEADIIAKIEGRPQCRTPAKNGPRPDRISVQRYGHHASYVKDGERIWGFEDRRGRDQFIADYAQHIVVVTRT